MSELLQQELDQYTAIPEQWQVDHAEAVACVAFEYWLKKGINLFDFITKADEQWRALVFSGQRAFDQQFSDQLLESYRKWHLQSERMLPALEIYERAGYPIADAEAFRSRAREAKGIITPDEEFFADERFSKLRDVAIDKHRAGQTHEFGAG